MEIILGFGVRREEIKLGDKLQGIASILLASEDGDHMVWDHYRRDQNAWVLTYCGCSCGTTMNHSYLLTASYYNRVRKALDDLRD